jgi:hypothetical protein
MIYFGKWQLICEENKRKIRFLKQKGTLGPSRK